MAASWSSNQDERRKNSPTTPPVGVPAMQRDASEHGTPPPVVYAGEAAPDNQHPTTSGLEPDASRTLPSSLVTAILDHAGALAALGLHAQVSMLYLSRSDFDTVDAAEREGWAHASAQRYWTRQIDFDEFSFITFFCDKSPVESEAAA